MHPVRGWLTLVLEPVARPLPSLHHITTTSVAHGGDNLNEEETHAFTLEPPFARHCGRHRSLEHRARRLFRRRRRRGAGDVGEADGVVTIIGTIADTEAELLEQSWADWETENDIDIQYESTKEFEAQIGSLAQGGNPPDLAIFPQPGLLADLATRGYMQPAAEGVALPSPRTGRRTGPPTAPSMARSTAHR